MTRLVGELGLTLFSDPLVVAVALVTSATAGCLIGSFLNVVIWRVPEHISIFNPKRSFCPKCNAQIKAYDNIPIISYMILRGKCRSCSEKISVRYPLVEALTGTMFLAVTYGAAKNAYPTPIIWNLYFFAAISVVIAFIDIDKHLILNVIVYPSFIISLILIAIATFQTVSNGENWTRLFNSLLCAVILGVAYFVLAIAWPGGMGFGDVKLAFVLGLTTGWLGWGQFAVGAFSAFLIGGLVSVILMLSKKVSIKGGIPFGPSMLAGAWTGIFAGEPIAHAYLQIAGLG